MISRRELGIYGAIAGGNLLAKRLLASEVPNDRLHHPATAQTVIMLFMAGGPSQVDTFDPKPTLGQLTGQNVPDSIASRVPKIKRAGLKNLMASPWEFRQHGESGIPVSSLFPCVAQHVDQLCLIRSMTHRNPVHGPGECVALTGSGTGQRPSLGAWILYGTGSRNNQLPPFVTMNLHTDGMQFPQAAGWGPGFLPSGFQATVVEPKQGIRHVTMPPGVTLAQRQAELGLIQSLNQEFLDSVGTSELSARLRSYRMADAMQSAGPELFDIGSEPAHIEKLYGIDQKETQQVGRACLLARRMTQRRVRYIQIRVGGWDAHGNIKSNHEKLAKRTDQPIAALIQDLQDHGLLDSTLVVWAGEFGRTPTMEGRGKGRDHSPSAYCVWLAGGGVKGGKIIGETDPIGYTVTERPVSPLDLHATILHGLGIDSRRLVYDHHGLEETPLGVGDGAPVNEVFRA